MGETDGDSGRAGGLALTAAGAQADDAPTIDQALKKKAPDVLQYLREHHDKNIAVLKFLVRLRRRQAARQPGHLNRTLADRLEVALVLALGDDDERGFSILTHASDAVDGSATRPSTTAPRTAGRPSSPDHPPAFRFAPASCPANPKRPRPTPS